MWPKAVLCKSFRLWISWFPQLRFCGRSRNLEFTITKSEFDFAAVYRAKYIEDTNKCRRYQTHAFPVLGLLQFLTGQINMIPAIWQPYSDEVFFGLNFLLWPLLASFVLCRLSSLNSVLLSRPPPAIKLCLMRATSACAVQHINRLGLMSI